MLPLGSPGDGFISIYYREMEKYSGSQDKEKTMSCTDTGINEIALAFAECRSRHDMDAFAASFASHAEFVNVVGMWWTGRLEGN